MRSLYIIGLLPQALALISWPGSAAQQPLQSSRKHYDPFAGDFDSWVNGTLDEFLAPGLAIAIVHGNKTYAKGYGYADLETEELISPRTLFYTGSTTKSFTAATMSKLVDSNDSAYNDIIWTTKLADLIRDDFVLQDEYATDHITLTDAMSHRTGMPRHDLSWINADVSLREQVRQMRHLPMHNEIRTTWEYCNLMFATVSHAIETVTGTAMGTLLQDWLWEPLGMLETFYSLSDALAYAEKTGNVTMARGYIYSNTTKSQVEVPFSDIPPSNGAGGVISNVLDYTHWLRTFLHPDNTSNPMTPSAIAYMTQPHMPHPINSPPLTPNTGYYGLALEGSVYCGHPTLSHGGSINGYLTEMFWIPDMDWGVVLMQNAQSLAIAIVFQRLLEDLLRVPVEERMDVKALARQAEVNLTEEMGHARERLYPDAGNNPAVSPALPLEEYEGVYHHPAYHNLTLSLSPHGSRADHSQQQAYGAAALPLYAIPSAKHYLNFSATFHHVSGEHWWVYFQMGPGHWMTDKAVKAKFEVGVDGKVRGIGVQAEPSMDELACFEKVG